LLLNHLPVVGIVLAALLILVAWMRRSDELVKVSLGLIVLLAVVAVIVFFTGEPAEEAVEYLAGVSHDVVERHEEAALVATVGMGVLGAAALLVLFWFRRHIVPRALVMTSLLATLGLSGVMGYVANLGGQIRHTEIAGGGAPDNDRVDDHDRR
jgi:uncharacterized membrane protein